MIPPYLVIVTAARERRHRPAGGCPCGRRDGRLGLPPPDGCGL